MDALDMILIFAGLMATAILSSGCCVCFVVWYAGSRPDRASEVCPPEEKS
jgi:hypothetical protein